MKIAVESYELYNNGILLCKWWDTEEDSIEEIESFVKEIHLKHGYSDDLELFVADYEDDDLGLYNGSESVEYAYEVSEAIEGLDEDERVAVGLLLENGVVSDLDEAIEKKDEIYCTGETSMEDVAFNYVEECGLLESMPENLKYYFDYEALGRDMDLEGSYFEDEEGTIWECRV